MELGHCSGEHKTVSNPPATPLFWGHAPAAVCHAALLTLGPEARSTAIATQRADALLVCFLEDSPCTWLQYHTKALTSHPLGPAPGLEDMGAGTGWVLVPTLKGGHGH